MNPTGRCPDCDGFGFYQVQFGDKVSSGKRCRKCARPVWTFTHEVHKGWYMTDCIAATKAELYRILLTVHNCNNDEADSAGLVPIKTTYSRISFSVRSAIASV